MSYWCADCRQVNREIPIRDNVDELGHPDSPFQAAIERDLRSVLDERIEALKSIENPQVIEAVRLHLIFAMTAAQVAVELGINDDTAGRRIRQGKEILRARHIFDRLGLVGEPDKVPTRKPAPLPFLIADEAPKHASVKPEPLPIDPVPEVGSLTDSWRFLVGNVIRRELSRRTSGDFFEWNFLRWVVSGISVESASWRLGITLWSGQELVRNFIRHLNLRLSAYGARMDANYNLVGIAPDILEPATDDFNLYAQIDPQWIVDHVLVHKAQKTYKSVWAIVGKLIEKFDEPYRGRGLTVWKDPSLRTQDRELFHAENLLGAALKREKLWLPKPPNDRQFQ